jgi:CarD family transcriptional regulator
MVFKVGDKAVYPAHGVGVVKKIETREIGGQKQNFYVLQIISSGATLMVPCDASSRVGMRSLISDKEIEQVYGILKGLGKISTTTWNRRFREFNEKLRTGSVSDVAEVLRDLNCLKSTKDLSFGEKKMMDRAKTMIIAELSAASRKAEEEIEKELSVILA